MRNDANYYHGIAQGLFTVALVFTLYILPWIEFVTDVMEEIL